MRLVFSVIALIAAADLLAAQVNTEQMRRSVDDDGVTVALDASAAFATGNTEYLRIGLGGRTDIRVGNDGAFIIGRFDLSEAEGRAFLDRSFLHARYTHTLTGPLKLETFAQFERNRQLRLQARTLFGVGLRLEAIARDSLGLALGLTPMFENEELDETLGNETTGAVRMSTYLSGRIAVGPLAELTAVVYAQPRADRPADLRVLGQAALTVGITRWVRVRVQANLRYDSRPPGTVKPTDVSIENGLVIVVPAG